EHLARSRLERLQLTLLIAVVEDEQGRHADVVAQPAEHVRQGILECLRVQQDRIELPLRDDAERGVERLDVVRLEAGRCDVVAKRLGDDAVGGDDEKKWQHRHHDRTAAAPRRWRKRVDRQPKPARSAASPRPSPASISRRATATRLRVRNACGVSSITRAKRRAKWNGDRFDTAASSSTLSGSAKWLWMKSALRRRRRNSASRVAGFAQAMRSARARNARS